MFVTNYVWINVQDVIRHSFKIFVDSFGVGLKLFEIYFIKQVNRKIIKYYLKFEVVLKLFPII